MGAIIRITAFLGRLNVHVNRPNQDKEYMVRHRELDNMLATIQFSIPPQFKYVPGSVDMQTAFLQNLTSVASILLNQAALYKSQLTELPLRLSDLASRCHMGALEIAATVRGTSNMHVTQQCAYTAFCIYVGARVFVEMLRQPAPTTAPASGPTKEDLEGDLNMMLAALQTFTEHVPLAGHFLMQLEADLNGLEKVISVRPYDVTLGYSECSVFSGIGKDLQAQQQEKADKNNGMWTKPSNPQVPSTSPTDNPYHRPQHSSSFDMRAPEQRVTYVDASRHSSLSTDSPSQNSSMATSIQALSSDSSPNIATPDSIRQFDPDKFFGDMTNLGGNSIDITMSMDQGMQGLNDDGFFTDMLGVNMNN